MSGNIERSSKNEAYNLFHNFLRPNMNDIMLWELYEIICDEIEHRQEILRESGVKEDDFRLAPISRITKKKGIKDGRTHSETSNRKNGIRKR